MNENNITLFIVCRFRAFLFLFFFFFFVSIFAHENVLKQFMKARQRRNEKEKLQNDENGM